MTVVAVSLAAAAAVCGGDFVASAVSWEDVEENKNFIETKER